MEMSVSGCRLPRVSRRPSSTSRNSGSAAARSPLTFSRMLRLLIELSVFRCRLPRISRRPSSASRCSGAAAQRRRSQTRRREAGRRGSRVIPPAPRGTAAQPRHTYLGPAAPRRAYSRWRLCPRRACAWPGVAHLGARCSAHRGTRPCTGRSGRLRPPLGWCAATARGSGGGSTWRSRGRRMAHVRAVNCITPAQTSALQDKGLRARPALDACAATPGWTQAVRSIC